MARAQAVQLEPEFDEKTKLFREFQKNMLNRDWRLRNLYRVIDKGARSVTFVPNSAQKQVYKDLAQGHKTVVLKIRQLAGITTALCILWLDSALWTKNLKIGIVADTMPNAKLFMRNKILYAYDQLPDEIKKLRPIRTRNTEEVVFENGSSIRAGVTFRSGDVQVLHVSEYGEICAKRPLHAAEIRTGAMEAVPMGDESAGVIVVESTAKGRTGHFHELCDEAQKGPEALSEWTMSFVPWWKMPEAVRSEPTMEYKEDKEYLDKLERAIDKRLTREQRNWWCAKRHALGDDVFSQYPGTPEEAFKQSVEGAYYARQMLDAWQKGRITTVKVDPNILVETWWDIGMDDANAIWFVQRNGTEIRLVDYYENSGEGIGHYAKYLREWQKEHGVVGYSRHIAPHDIMVRQWGTETGETRLAAALKLGVMFEKAPQMRLGDQIDLVRRTLPMCAFDSGRCAEGIEHLEHYRKQWNEVLSVWRDQPLHDESSHAASAFATGASMTGDGLPTAADNARRQAIVAPQKRKVVW